MSQAEINAACWGLLVLCVLGQLHVRGHTGIFWDNYHHFRGVLGPGLFNRCLWMMHQLRRLANLQVLCMAALAAVLLGWLPAKYQLWLAGLCLGLFVIMYLLGSRVRLA